jgi:recombination associated protein RdgC
MWFKNLVFSRLPADGSVSPLDLEQQLASRTLQPVSPLEMMSRGWVAPAPTGRLVHVVGRQQLIALAADQRLLPASVIRQVVKERAEALAQEQGFPVGRRQMRQLKMTVADELRPRAFTRRRVIRAWLDPEGRWFGVEAAGAPRAEELGEVLRDTLGTFPIEPVDTERPPHVAMATWLRTGDAPLRFAIDQDLELQAADRSKATIRYSRHPLDGKQIQAHLQNGMTVTRLGLTWNDRISFVLTDKLHLKRIQFLEVQGDAADGGETDTDEALRFDAEFALMAGQLSTLLTELVQALGGESARDRAAA